MLKTLFRIPEVDIFTISNKSALQNQYVTCWMLKGRSVSCVRETRSEHDTNILMFFSIQTQTSDRLCQVWVVRRRIFKHYSHKSIKLCSRIQIKSHRSWREVPGGEQLRHSCNHAVHTSNRDSAIGLPWILRIFLHILWDRKLKTGHNHVLYVHATI